MPAPALTSADARTLQVAGLYEGLDRAGLAGLLEHYAPDAFFKDPFNEVRGRDAIGRVFEHMFDQLTAPRFVVLHAVSEADDAFLTWEFHFRRAPDAAPFIIRGASHLAYAPDGRIAAHRDYWDAAEELYAKLPLLGALMRWLQRRLRVPQP